MRKARVSKWWSKHNLPEELWPEILSRLPVKSLLRFRCVSRSTIPISLAYISLASTTAPIPQSSLSKLAPRLSVLSRTAKLSEPFLAWPSSRATLNHPMSSDPPTLAKVSTSVGGIIGFDPSTRDYIVVGFSFGKGQRFAQTYTLKTNSWKLTNSHGHHTVDGFTRPPISFNGVLYALTFSGTLGSFDLKTEVYASFELPLTDRNISKSKLTILHKGSLLALVHVYKFKGSIWTLESLGADTNARSWIQLYTFDTVPPREIDEYDFLCMKNNGEMLMRWFCKVICYNPETHHKKILMEKNRKNFRVDNTTPYVESLILLS